MKEFFFQRLLLWVARVFLFVFFVAIFSFAAAQVPDAGSIYANWIEKILVAPPDGDNAFKTPLSNVTVKQSHALVDQNGKETAWGEAGKVLIGEKNQSATEALKIAAENATIKISATSGNSELSFGDTAAQHGSVYFDKATGTLKVWNEENGIEISETEVNFPKGAWVNGQKLVTVFFCEDSKMLVGFDGNGNSICDGISGVGVNWVAVPKGSCSDLGMQSYEVKCRDGNDEFATILNDLVCQEKNLPRPSNMRKCSFWATDLPEMKYCHIEDEETLIDLSCFIGQ